jgi:hypothetical protein
MELSEVGDEHGADEGVASKKIKLLLTWDIEQPLTN